MPRLFPGTVVVHKTNKEILMVILYDENNSKVYKCRTVINSSNPDLVVQEFVFDPWELEKVNDPTLNNFKSGDVVKHSSNDSVLLFVVKTPSLDVCTCRWLIQTKDGLIVQKEHDFHDYELKNG